MKQPAKTRGIGLLCGENFIILIHPYDRQADGRAGDYIARSAYMLSRAKNQTM